MFQDSNGVWWSDDQTQYNDGSGWIRYNHSSTATVQQTTARSSSHQGSNLPYQSAHAGAQLGSPDPQTLGDSMAALLGGRSITPYQQPGPPNGVFGENRQTPGKSAVPALDLDHTIRDAAKRDPFIAAFVASHDTIGRGGA